MRRIMCRLRHRVRPMGMTSPTVIALVAIAVSATAGHAQRDTLTGPTDYIIWVTEAWGRTDTRLGDLRTKPASADDIELRFWGGYGLVGTRGIILRRASGRWSASRVDVRRCEVYLPIPVGDTLSETSRLRYEAQARRECDKHEPPPPIEGGFLVISSDTLDVIAVRPRGKLDHIWQELTDAGIMTLPPFVKRSWRMVDGHTYVTQLRIGQDYRASRIEDIEPPEAQADRSVQEINRILAREIGWGH